MDVKTEFAISKKIKEIEKDTNQRFDKLTKEYFKDGGEASKIIERYVAKENDKKNNQIETEDEEELN